MTYCIIGSTSFAGSSFVNYLLSRKEKVIGVSRSPEYHPVLRPYFQHTRDFKFFQCDLNHDLATLTQLIATHKPKYIIDFAGQGMVAESWQDPAQWYLTNIVAKVKLHHFLKDCDFLEKYVRVSTPEVYGSTSHAVTEDQPSHPSTPYAVSHAAIDMSLMAFFKQYQFPVVLTRFANFYGPYQQLYRIIPRTMIYALTRQTLPLHGGGTSERSFIYMDDVSRALDQTLLQGRLGQTYHFTTSPCFSIRQVVQKICDLMQVEMSSFVKIAEERAGKDNKYEMDATKAQTELHWQPQVTLEEGLAKTLAWVQDNIKALQTLPLHYIHKA